MKTITMNTILSRIQKDFTDFYPNAASFTCTPFYFQCMAIISNISDLQKIVSKNDQKTPPVQTLFKLLEERQCQVNEITDFDDICVGELMAFIFKHIFEYKNQKNSVPIEGNFRPKTAALYFDSEDFTILE